MNFVTCYMQMFERIRNIKYVLVLFAIVIAYDEARRNPLQKLFRDKRDDRKKDDTSQESTNTDKPEKAS